MSIRAAHRAVTRRHNPGLDARIDTPARPTRSLNSAIGLMRERGLHAAAARRLVIEALLAADGPMSAEQIAEGICRRVPRSDVGLVYRNLQALQEIGLIRHVHLGHGPGLHALAVAGEREYLTCARCGDYRALMTEGLDPVRALIERWFGYRASLIHFPIVGLCPSRATEARSSNPYLDQCTQRSGR